MALLVGFAGSLRKDSFNRALIAAAAASMPAGSTLEVLSIDDVPLYNADVESTDGIPPAVVRIKDRIAAADGLVIATPEYNGGIPGIAKNVMDWASRPSEDIPRVFRGKPVALMGATPGGMGTAFSQGRVLMRAAGPIPNSRSGSPNIWRPSSPRWANPPVAPKLVDPTRFPPVVSPCRRV